MKRSNQWRWIPALLWGLLVCCGLATAALAVSTDRANAAQAQQDKGYTLREDIEIEAEQTPLASGAEQTRCVLHFVLLALAAADGVYFLYSLQKHRARQRALLARLRT